MRIQLLMLAVVVMIGTCMDIHAEEAPLKLGLIGLDTSHVIAFTQVLNNPDHADHVPGAKIVAAYKGSNPAQRAWTGIPNSWRRNSALKLCRPLRNCVTKSTRYC